MRRNWIREAASAQRTREARRERGEVRSVKKDRDQSLGDKSRGIKQLEASCLYLEEEKRNAETSSLFPFPPPTTPTVHLVRRIFHRLRASSAR